MNWASRIEKCRVFFVPLAVFLYPGFQTSRTAWNRLILTNFNVWGTFSIFEAKFIFSDKNTVELMPIMSKLAWNRLFPGNIQSSRKFLEVSRTDGKFEFCIKNQVPWQKLSGKNTQYIEIGQNQPIPGHFWISGCLESRMNKLTDGHKRTKKWFESVIQTFFAPINWKTIRFGKFVKNMSKSSRVRKDNFDH